MKSFEKLQEALSFLQTNKSFLGKEFLTWLWFQTESQNHRVTVKNQGTFYFCLDDKIIFNSSSGSVRENCLKGGTPAYAYEAFSALNSGKFVCEAKFILQTDSRQWSFTLRGENLSLHNIKLPSCSERDSRAHILKRMDFLKTLVSVLEQLYKDFIEKRLSGEFSTELANMKHWMMNKTAL